MSEGKCPTFAIGEHPTHCAPTVRPSATPLDWKAVEISDLVHVVSVVDVMKPTTAYIGCGVIDSSLTANTAHEQNTTNRWIRCFCRLKACVAAFSLYCIDFLDSFRNKSGKPQPIPTKVGKRAQLKGRQLSRNFGRDRPSRGEMGARTRPAQPVTFCKH